MTVLNYILLPVKAPLASAELYDQLLGARPVEKTETFVLYVLPTGLKLGLWLRDTMEPRPAEPGGLEICFTEPDNAAVTALHKRWSDLGLKTIQAPRDMDFGFTFVVEDPDGHRLRAFARAADPR